MTKNTAFFLTLTFLCSLSSLAQRIDIDKKALSFLTTTDTVSVVFSYKGLIIDDGVPESMFLKNMRVKIIDHRNEEEANQWAEDYKEFKAEIWASSFVAELNERLGKAKNAPLFSSEDMNANYTMNVNIPWMYFGYDGGIVKQPAKVTMQIDFIETKKPEQILFTTEIRRAMGKYNKTDGDGEGAGPSLNRMRKALEFGAFKLAQSLKRVVN